MVELTINKQSFLTLIGENGDPKTDILLTKLIDQQNVEITHLQRDNQRLQQEIVDLARFKRIFEEKNKWKRLEGTESRLLKMKLKKLENDKQNLLENFENETKILEGLIKDNSKLKHNENQIHELQMKLDATKKEINIVKDQLIQVKSHNKELNEIKLKYEWEINDLTERNRLLQEKYDAIEVEEIENKILQLKLESCENEKRYLQEEFDRERKFFADTPHYKEILRENREQIDKLEETVNILRHELTFTKLLLERAETESKDLYEMKVKLERQKIESNQTETVNDETWEKEKQALIEGFQMERNVFRRLITQYNDNISRIEKDLALIRKKNVNRMTE